jgi:tetratricopeptide (TPR) repeat protein
MLLNSSHFDASRLLLRHKNLITAVGWVEERNPTSSGVGFRRLNPTYKMLFSGIALLNLSLPWVVAPGAIAQSFPSLKVVEISNTSIQQIANSVTVLIDGANPGSGVLVDRVGSTYYVLTAAHVVASADGYTLVTPTGERVPIDYSRVVKFPQVDLALVPFESSQSYSVATLANYAYTANFQTVYTAGWAATRSPRFSAGLLGDRDFSLALTQGLRQDGYELFYSNATEVGMSGGPLFDADGRVIGIHGLAEGEQVIDGQRGPTRVKRGFSAGIPISTMLRLLPQLALNLAPRVETTPPRFATLPDSTPPDPSPDPAPETAADWTNRGNALYRQGDLPAALRALNQALQIDRRFHPAWYERGNVLFAMNRHIEALEAYDRTIDLKPDLYSVWRDRGVLLSVMGQYTAALGCFDRATELKPDDYVLWYMRGNLLNKNLRDYSAAISSYDRALAINPNFADAWMGRGKALHQQGQYELALADYNKAIQLNADLSVVWILQARTLARLGRQSEAIASAQQALQLKPNDPDARELLALLRSSVR